MFEEMMGGKKIIKVRSITLIESKDSPLKLPVLRVLVKQYDDIVVGHCLDFDIYGYYEEKDLDFEKGAKNVCAQIGEMSVLKVLGHLINGTESCMFDNSLPLGDLWSEFLGELRKEKIKEIRSCYDAFFSSNKEALKNKHPRYVHVPTKI